MEFPAEVDSLLPHFFLEQHLVCVAVSAMEGVLVSGGGGSFRLSRRNYNINSVYHPTLRLWAVLVLAAKLPNQGEMYGLPPFSLRVSPSSSPAYMWPLSAKYESEMRL